MWYSWIPVWIHLLEYIMYTCPGTCTGIAICHIAIYYTGIAIPGTYVFRFTRACIRTRVRTRALDQVEYTCSTRVRSTLHVYYVCVCMSIVINHCNSPCDFLILCSLCADSVLTRTRGHVYSCPYFRNRTSKQ